MAKVNMAVIGIGARGSSMLNALCNVENAYVSWACDIYEDRAIEGAKKIKERQDHEGKWTTDYHDILNDPEVDGVLICTSWNTHTMIAIDSMKAGKKVACEVYGAYSIDECWSLVKAYEETKTPFMFLENCCFDEFELLSTSLYRNGKLGKVVYGHGCYAHDLRDEITQGNINRHYRLEEYTHRNCENYPTHDLGPIAKILDINRGNRMVSLTSMGSVPGVGLDEYIKEGRCKDAEVAKRKFNQADIVSTMIKCANGELITLRLDTTLPRFYDREFTIRGTKGMTNMTNKFVYLEDEAKGIEYWDPIEAMQKFQGNSKDYSKYLPSIWRDISEKERTLGHGGMDFIELQCFIDHCISGEEMPIDVYDAASWMAITALSEESVNEGGSLKSIPDFTRGQWARRKPKDVVELPKVSK